MRCKTRLRIRCPHRIWQARDHRRPRRRERRLTVGEVDEIFHGWLIERLDTSIEGMPMIVSFSAMQRTPLNTVKT